MLVPNLVAGLLLLLPRAVARSTFTYNEVEAQISSYTSQNISQIERSPGVGCAIACNFLDASLPGRVAYTDSRVYHLESSRYWSQQQALTQPRCRLTPISADDVSLAILTLRVTQCKFAVKSGGHVAFAGASNIEGGVTIDLMKLNETSVSTDKTETAVGAGNIWYDVYSYLQPKGLTVIGGRVSAIGVGGLTLGGGISFFSNRYGWACDNVNSFEVVFADGSIHEVSHDSKYSDLFWALRGGGNNFGIVTKFNLATYPQGDLWAGAETFIYTKETGTLIDDAFYHLAINSPSDPFAQVIVAYAYAQPQDTFIIASDLQYGKPTPYPAILKNFTSIPNSVASTLRVTDLANLTLEFNATNPGGFRQTYWTLTVGNSASLMSEMTAIYMDEVRHIKDAQGLVPSIVFQPIPMDMTKHFAKNGGNPLGLENQEPLNLINIAISWSNPLDDDRIISAARNMVNRSKQAAARRGLHNQYLYQNYASKEQDVFPGYGEKNWLRLKEIRVKYDPFKVWQRLQPGYFNLE